MESSSSKPQVMKPVFLKAGIPLVVSLAGFIFAKITTRNSCPKEASSSSSESVENNQEADSCETFQLLKEEILGLRRRTEEMKDTAWRLEKRFIAYQELKDQEMVLMELKNKLVLEINRVEFLGREVELLEGENQRFESIVVGHLEVLRFLEFSRMENGKLHRRIKKLLTKSRQNSGILRKQRLQIECQEREILRNKNGLEVKDDCIRLLEDEIKELKGINEVLQGEKDELLCKLRAAEELATSKEGETVTIEKYNQLACELERLQKDEAAEAKEIIYLKWCNACLRHQLMRMNQQQEQEHMEEYNNSGEIEEFELDHEVNSLTNESHCHSRRRKLIAKLKKWLEKEKHGNKCFRRHSVSHGTEEPYFPARKSCSSA